MIANRPAAAPALAAVSAAALAVGASVLAETSGLGGEPAEGARRLFAPEGRQLAEREGRRAPRSSTSRRPSPPTYRNPYFGQQYDGARNAGIIRGAYHFALPDRSSGATQAAYFVRNGGRWSADGWTLPPALDIEYNPYDKKHKCYGLSKARMVDWIKSFSDEVKRLTGRRPVIYTTAHWWNTCTGRSRAFASNHALWIARHDSADAGSLPAGWSFWTFWQYDNSGSLPGDQNLFNGSRAQLRRFARSQ